MKRTYNQGDFQKSVKVKPKAGRVIPYPGEDYLNERAEERQLKIEMKPQKRSEYFSEMAEYISKHIGTRSN